MNKVLQMAVVAALGIASAAHASGTLTRVWVSNAGTDTAGCGPVTLPCRSLQYAHDNAVAPGGEIDIHDPGGYGALTITMAVSIVNDGVGTAGVQASSGNAITINAGPADAIYLRGLNVDGLGVAANGIVFSSGAGLTVSNCTIRHFTGNGVELQPTQGTPEFAIFNDEISDLLGIGVWYAPPVGSTANSVAFLNHMTVNSIASGSGIVVDTQATDNAKFTIENSDANNNGAGVVIFGGASSNNLVATIDSIHTDNNVADGMFLSGSAIVHVNRSTANSNHQDGIRNSTVAPGVVYSTGTNLVKQNGGVNISAPLTTELYN